MDYFYEESVRKINTKFNVLLYVIAFIGMALCGIAALVQLLFILNGVLDVYTISILIISGLASYGFFLFKNNQSLEFDYTFTNGILDIAKVINNNKRKKILSTDIREFQLVAPISHKGFQHALSRESGIRKRYNCFLNRGAKLYYGVFTHEGTKSLIVFEPSQEMLKLFKAFNPRNIEIES